MIKHFVKIKLIANLIGRTHCALMHIKTTVHTQNNVNIL